MSVSVGDGVSLTLVQPDIYRGDVAPVARRVGDMWMDTSGGTEILKRATSVSPTVWEAVDSGGGGSQAALQFQDEGINLGAAGTVDTVDFTGSGVVASRIGNVVTLVITGGGGGGGLTHPEVLARTCGA